jgi:hypothetical protein
MFFIEKRYSVVNTIFLKTILDGLAIGSWVFLWEAIAGVVIRNQKNRYMIRLYKRLIKSELYFIYTGQVVPS